MRIKKRKQSPSKFKDELGWLLNKKKDGKHGTDGMHDTSTKCVIISAGRRKIVRQKHVESREHDNLSSIDSGKLGRNQHKNFYEGRFTGSFARAISLQILGTGHVTIPHIKAMDVPYHLIYGSLICAKRLQSDRQNKVGCLQTPAGRQNMIIKYLSVGQRS